jgi:hypothetical protein
LISTDWRPKVTLVEESGMIDVRARFGGSGGSTL